MRAGSLAVDKHPGVAYLCRMAKQRRRPPQEFIADIRVEYDGIAPVRSAQPWTRDKLGILRSYLPAFATACKAVPNGFYFVDAMAGCGLCSVEATNEWLLGSTPLALSVEPRFTRCVAMDVKQANVKALRQRVAKYGERAAVLEGDCNVELEGAMTEFIPVDAPVFVLLDPEGTELHWKTVATAARHREGRRKSELLILLISSWLDRLLPNEGEVEPHNLSALLRCMPTLEWQETWRMKLAGEITSEEGRQRHAASYAAWLGDDLGYEFVETRSVTRPGRRASVYHLIFATDHVVGSKIMSDVFKAMYPNEPNLRLPGLLD